MGLSRWLRPGHRPARTFRPAVLQLEDRTVPSSFSGLGPPPGFFPPPGPATHLQIIVPESVQANQTFRVVVEAEDASGQLAAGYTGTVTFASSDSGATGAAAFTRGTTLVALSSLSYQFTAGDHGLHAFRFQITTTNPTTITAGDRTASFSSTATTNAATQTATTLALSTSEQAATGVATAVTVDVLDQAGQVMHKFIGPVTLSSSDTTATGSAGPQTAAASLPITYNFKVRDHGQHTFLVTFNEAAAATGTTTTVSAATTTPALNGSASLPVYRPTAVTHFAVFAAPIAYKGGNTPVLVVALNASNQVVTGYTGIVSFTSTDAAAAVAATQGGTTSPLPGFTYQFNATDAGQHTFFFTFGTIGKRTLTVTDSATSVSATVNVQVLTPPPKHWWG